MKNNTFMTLLAMFHGAILMLGLMFIGLDDWGLYITFFVAILFNWLIVERVAYKIGVRK